MKLLLIGDFGGRLPRKLVSTIKKEEFDYVLCNGDYADISKIRKLFFKYGDDMGDHITTQEANKIRTAGNKKAEPILKWLGSLEQPVVSVNGNNEAGKFDHFMKLANKHDIIWLLDEAAELEHLTIVGAFAPYYEDEEQELYVSSLIDDPKNTIFLTHYPPYNCELDLLPMDNPVNPGGRAGLEWIRDVVDEKQPAMVICGHLEEYVGECKIGKTRVINPGAAHDGEYAILTMKNSLAHAKIEYKKA